MKRFATAALSLAVSLCGSVLWGSETAKPRPGPPVKIQLAFHGEMARQWSLLSSAFPELSALGGPETRPIPVNQVANWLAANVGNRGISNEARTVALSLAQALHDPKYLAGIKSHRESLGSTEKDFAGLPLAQVEALSCLIQADAEAAKILREAGERHAPEAAVGGKQAMDAVFDLAARSADAVDASATSQTLPQPRFLEFYGDPVQDVAPVPNSSLIALATHEGVRLWDPRTGLHEWAFESSRDSLSTRRNLAVSPDGQKVALIDSHISYGSIIRLWDARSRRLTQVRPAPAKADSPVFTSDSRYLIYSSGRSVGMADARTGKPVPGWRAWYGRVEGGSKFGAARGELFVSGGDFTGIRRYSLLPFRLKENSGSNVKLNHGLAVAPSGNLVAAIGAADAADHTLNTNVYLWNPFQKSSEFRALNRDHHWLYQVAISPDERLVAGRGLSSVVLWDARSGRELGRTGDTLGAGDNTPLAFSADGNLLLFETNRGRLGIWDISRLRGPAALAKPGPGDKQPQAAVPAPAQKTAEPAAPGMTPAKAGRKFLVNMIGSAIQFLPATIIGFIALNTANLLFGAAILTLILAVWPAALTFLLDERRQVKAETPQPQIEAAPQLAAEPALPETVRIVTGPSYITETLREVLHDLREVPLEQMRIVEAPESAQGTDAEGVPSLEAEVSRQTAERLAREGFIRPEWLTEEERPRFDFNAKLQERLRRLKAKAAERSAAEPMIVEAPRDLEAEAIKAYERFQGDLGRIAVAAKEGRLPMDVYRKVIDLQSDPELRRRLPQVRFDSQSERALEEPEL